MLKMLLDPLGGIVITNDGNAILREVDVAHPAAKSLIELARSQDEEVGDGSTSVVVLGGEVLQVSVSLLQQQQLHPLLVVQGYMHALTDAVSFLQQISTSIDTADEGACLKALEICLQTKFSSHAFKHLGLMALRAVKKIARRLPSGKLDIDIKRYAKIEKIPGGDIEESCLLDGLMLNKDVVHPRMRRRIENPRVLLLDCPLEYKKGESQTNVEITKEEEWDLLLQQEETAVLLLCEKLAAAKPDLIITEKGVSDLAQHYLAKENISVIRRVRKTDNNRISRATGATVVSRPEEICAQDIGTKCKLFEVRKIGDEYYSFFLECTEGTACTLLLRGGSKDVLNEVERNLQDALCVGRNILLESKLVPGGGAAEMAVAARLLQKAKSIESVHQYAYRAIASALEVIPRTLAQNCGANVVKVMTDLRACHSRLDAAAACMGVDGETGEVCDVVAKNIWDCLAVKQQIYKQQCCCA
ncbi:TCP-1/cpn60 family chaperonin, putative [Eimeria brunetti]|uniref:T-complex protein 1 subunit gamma n=1 Tax=Eimeria brunetti TaxID=51314 RepID=U6LHQ3_9EIME|nr:TCP-1/cpn60 family chaperonin, putative [Eimeria brunetti]